ncbi:MAG TPA: 50S ribosomal protein L29 [Candidatus Onthomorpha intestinigallinarum]|uniref:Large ribosomal subunit protein uL29 n=1 Tax=Candidatus Onthomorpha intestinigallinarum TaxID=2840880 RepID=A0A9D1UI41_9BACT|nr:50S ribosomal protein L29 [Candidatus Onthomorpha intestinigallinarum]
MKSNSNGLKELSVSELQERLKGEELRLAKLKINHAVSSLENPNVIRETRKNIARINTELRSRQ